MRLGRTIRKGLVIVLAVSVACVVTGYVLVSWVPGDYRPARLGREQREEATSRFYNRVFRFISDGEDIQPFTWTVGEQQLNGWLASMDEIAYRRGGKRGHVHTLLAKARLAEPAVALGDGEMKLMVRSTEHDKVLSATLRFELTAGGQLRVRLAGTRVGRLPLPRFLVRERVRKLQRTVVQRLLSSAESQDARESDPSKAGVARVLARVVAAIDGQAIDTELTWRLHSRKRVRIAKIDIDGRAATLHVVPVGRAGPAR